MRWSEPYGMDGMDGIGWYSIAGWQGMQGSKNNTKTGRIKTALGEKEGECGRPLVELANKAGKAVAAAHIPGRELAGFSDSSCCLGLPCPAAAWVGNERDITAVGVHGDEDCWRPDRRWTDDCPCFRFPVPVSLGEGGPQVSPGQPDNHPSTDPLLPPQRSGNKSIGTLDLT